MTAAAFSNIHGVNPSDIVIIIPTYNAARYFSKQIEALAAQGYPIENYLVVDSSSTDGTRDLYKSYGMEVVTIPQSEFNHGGTRRFAVAHRPDAKFVIMMTQDAIPAHDRSLYNIIAGFSDEQTGLCYGRQLARHEARGIEKHARLMNYPPTSEVRSMADATRMGIKTTFCSNSFAAYRRSALEAVGSFPQDSYFAEDQVVAGKMLLQGWKIAYHADATVIHSHEYSIIEDFRRYFDVGVFHARNRWLLESFGTAEGEGIKFIISELKFLMKNDPMQLISAFLRTPAKYIAYRLGKTESSFSSRSKRILSMQPFYWK